MSMSLWRCRGGSLMRHPHTRQVLMEMEQAVNTAYENGVSRGGFWNGMWRRQSIAEQEHQFELKVELPGIPKDKINVERLGDQLKVFAEDKGADSLSRFEQVYNLPESADLAKISANSNDGVLTVRIPKTEHHIESSKPVNVKVE
uniref:SHSP domain-containing protein n=1 Tax=Rhodosorus marinus TaxID=101924 RepID=A0A7S0BE29_9RHOD|mmetsp:Transcript_11225/g.16222  ORF Transcript_11225/g.16222 Transcript_11225/m.16222 type:complete len:145 (+) Transcript_11225:106-540(+)